MEITTTLAAIAVFIAAATYSISLIIALIRGREPKVISRMAMRKQLHNTYIDIDFNLTEEDTDETAVQKIVDANDRLGVAFEKAKSDFEDEQDRKRQATPPAYQDPAQANEALAADKKQRKNKRRR